MNERERALRSQIIILNFLDTICKLKLASGKEARLIRMTINHAWLAYYLKYVD